MDDIDQFLNAPNYYSALGLDRTNFTTEQVDKAYKKFALKFHPDKNKNPKATQAFMKLGEIKETLKDTSKRNIYDNCTFQSNSEPKFNTVFDTNTNEWSDLMQHPQFEKTDRTEKRKHKKRKNLLYPLYAVFILIALFTFVANTEPFSNSITKESLAKVIKFSLENENLYDYTLYTSKILQVPFYIPKEWERDNILSTKGDIKDWELLREQIRMYADQIYKEKLQLDCENEKKSSWISHPSCLRLQKIL